METFERRTRGRRGSAYRRRAIAATLAFSIWIAPGLAASATAKPQGPPPSVRTVITGKRAELRETVPIASHVGGRTRSVLSVHLPRLRPGARVSLAGEVGLTTTCVQQIARCIGRSYRFDPHLRARIVLADKPEDTKRSKTIPVSRSVSLTCEQTRPNRNHHCPLVVAGSFRVRDLGKLPCGPSSCRLNMLVDASNRKARSNQYVVVGSDQPDGSVEGGKARLSAAVSVGDVKVSRRRTTHRRTKSLPAAFENGKKVVYSLRLGNLRKRDVLLVGSRQVSSIQRTPYFISNQIIVSTRPGSTRPSALARRAVSRTGTATETNGFNCTLGPSAFSSPCTGTKAGIARIQHVPRGKTGKAKPLYVNLVSRGFPKLIQARGGYPPVHVLDRGFLEVTRIRGDRRELQPRTG